MARFYALEEEIGIGTALLCGLQHVLAMFVGIVTPPLIVSASLGLDAAGTALLVRMALFASGITTFIQVRRIGPVGSGLLSVQGTSFTFVGPATQTGAAGGLPLILGMTLAAAPVEMLVSRFLDRARRLLPPVVTGTVVTLIGLNLVGVGMVDMAGGFGAEDLGSWGNLGLGVFTLGAIVILNRLGPGMVRTLSVALGLVAGYLLALALGRVDLAPVADAAWLQVPRPLAFGLAFDPVYLLPWIIAYLVSAMESVGDLTATSQVSREPVKGPVFLRRIKGGILADGLGSMVAGLLNCMPNTTFSQNNGVIGLTGVASRRAGYAVAGILVVLGLFPKFAALVGAMPPPVLGGATLLLFATVAVAGLRIVWSEPVGAREELILAVSLALGLGVTMVPEATATLGDIDVASRLAAAALASVEVVLQSGLAVGALTAMGLNLLLPRAPG